MLVPACFLLEEEDTVDLRSKSNSLTCTARAQLRYQTTLADCFQEHRVLNFGWLKQVVAHFRPVSGSSSAVERQLPKLDVAGSIPVSRSIFSRTYGLAHPIKPPYAIRWMAAQQLEGTMDLS